MTTVRMLLYIRHLWLLKNVKETLHCPTFSHCVEWTRLKFKIWLNLLEFHITKEVISFSVFPGIRNLLCLPPILSLTSPLCKSLSYINVCVWSPDSLCTTSATCVTLDHWILHIYMICSYIYTYMCVYNVYIKYMFFMGLWTHLQNCSHDNQCYKDHQII